MEKPSSTCRRQYMTVAVCMLIMTVCGSHLLAADRQPLRILLTNDDGYDAPGIKAVYKTLVAAGHDVTLIAPLTNQSGSGARITTRGVLEYKEQSPGIWSVDGSPADSVLVGLKRKMNGADSPDVVISGANFGQNLGYGSRSGTVGAAMTAMYLGVPAIAVSVGVDSSERNAKPIRFPSTVRAFEEAAKLTLALLDNLQNAAVDTGKLLPEHTILNVNYPAVSSADLKGVRIAQAARGGSGYIFDYEDTDQNGQLQVKIRIDPPSAEGDSDTDVELFFDGYAAIAVLDGDWDAGAASRKVIRRRLPDIVDQ